MKTKTKLNVVATTRRVYQQKGTLYIAIPRKFAQKHDIQPGDELIILADETMRVIPRETWSRYGRPEQSGRYITINGQVIPLEDR